MNRPPPHARSYANRLSAALLMAMLMWLPAAAHSAGFSLAGSDLRNDDTHTYLNARFDVALSREAEEALQSGVPLQLELQIRVTQPRRWWWDAELAEFSVRTELLYHALSRRYVVLNHETGERRTFFRRDAALNAWASVASRKVIAHEQLDSGERYVLHLRARLDTDRLPHPLRTVALVSPEWRLVSEWYTWPLPG
ncbi:DUF4390 domain-containing protein [Aquisalimonas sp.]|uniref:DUF4390 domain-containing protein n=1 Tax=unclassified Aquisalimonas TaxID=2644645 RepID=UPI0025C14992|nr:DUF4390 domain-containing protein [Aquisalimonas sp.]